MYCNITDWSHPYTHCYTIPGWSYHTPTLTVTLSHMKPCTVTSRADHTPTLTVTLSRADPITPPTLTVTLSHMKPCTVTSLADPITPLPSLLHYPWLILLHPYPHGYTIPGWSYHTSTLTVTLSWADPITPLPSRLHYPWLILLHPCWTMKVKATEPYYIRATFLPLRHFSTFIHSETPLYT